MLAICLLLALKPFAPSSDYRDDFRSGAKAWAAGPEWHAASGAASRFVGDTEHDTYAWRTDWRLEKSWSASVEMTIAVLLGSHGTSGAGGIGVSGAGTPSPTIVATITRHASKMTLIELKVLSGEWRNLLISGWISGGDKNYRLNLERQAGDDFVHIVVTGDQGLRYESDSPPLPLKLLDSLVCIGLRAAGSRVEFASASVETPNPDTSSYRKIATTAVNDLLNHFWIGDEKTGNIAATWNGYPATQLPDARGALWDRGTLIRVLDGLHKATRDATLLQRIQAEWRHMKAVYSKDEFKAAGSSLNSACDDCGWNALTLLILYRATGDKDALEDAHALVKNAFDRWQDEKLGGSLWYSDERKMKSLYQVGLVLAAFEIADETGDNALRNRAISCYQWMESKLLRTDGLYWCDYSATGPVGADRPNDIHEAGSVTFLAGAMAMGVLHSRLYRSTHGESYLRRAIRSADAILSNLTDGHGVLLDERDAWANGTFAGEWASEVLTLPGIRPDLKNLLRGTARAIAVRDRTPDGYYGGCWNGPADGAGSCWSRIGSRPQQLLTSANAVNVIVAALLSDIAPPIRRLVRITGNGGAASLNVSSRLGVTCRE